MPDINAVQEQNSPSETANLWTLFWTFLKIGSTAFGGFMALISVVQNYTVERRKLLRHEDILDATSLATILPGPIAMNVVAYVGYRLHGIAGAVTTTVAVTLPSFLLILFLSHVYFTWGEIPAVNKFFQGFLPAVAAIIVSAAWNMGKKTLTGIPEILIAVTAFIILIAIGGFYSTLTIILCSGIIGFFAFKEKSPAKSPSPEKTDNNNKKTSNEKGKLLSIAAAPVAAAAAPLLSTDFALAAKLMMTFGGMSVLLFGGGFVFIPLMQESIVETYGWVTHQEFIDAIALGQVTPGPILISATFVGYKVAGLLGATAATIGIFTPPAIIMLICSHYLDKIKTSKALRATMKGIRSAVIGMIFAASIVVAQTAEPNLISLGIFLVALVALIRFKVEVAYIIPLAGLTAFLLY